MHCGQDAINPHTPIGQCSRSREVFVLGLLLVPSRLMTDLPPCMSRQMGGSGLLFQISFQPSVCSELIELNWLDHCLLSLNILTRRLYLLRANKNTPHAMAPPG